MSNTNDKKTDPLKSLLQQNLMDTPPAGFSDRLLQASMASYRVRYSKKYQKEERLGKVILVILIFFNLVMLVKLRPFGVDPVLVIGIFVLLIFLFAFGVHYIIRNLHSVQIITPARRLVDPDVSCQPPAS